jgi:starch-binding outer membrane protein, SusD/RagB family
MPRCLFLSISIIYQPIRQQNRHKYAYLESIKNDQAKMAELIRNERRIELCFEGFRFWDLRRWKSNLTETAKGMNISGTRYTPMEVDKRSFSEYMYYGPIPYSEVLKYDELKQNQGW